MGETVHIKASCHCTMNTFRVAFESSRLPIENELCHCNSCRHSSGQVGMYHVNIDGGPYHEEEDVPASLENLKEYRSSPIASRWFCKTCGAHVLWKHDSAWLLDDVENPANQEVAKRYGIDLGAQGPRTYWAVAAGLLERVEGIVQVGYHIYVGDTMDGGLADHFRGEGGKELKRWAGRQEASELLPRGWRAPGFVQDDKLRFHCQCRAVELYIPRPPARSRPATEAEWWLPEDPTRYLAGYCGCESCRRTAGFEMVAWGFVQRENVYDGKTGERFDFGAEACSGMEVYGSSEGKKRYFCSTCGASVFWTSAERMHLVDIAMGLVDEEQNGGRAEGWFVWYGKLNAAVEMLSGNTIVI